MLDDQRSGCDTQNYLQHYNFKVFMKTFQNNLLSFTQEARIEKINSAQSTHPQYLSTELPFSIASICTCKSVSVAPLADILNFVC